MVEVTQEAQKAALKHLGYDSMEDAHYWAKDNYDLDRLDALIAVIDEAIVAALTTAQTQAAAQEQRIAELEGALGSALTAIQFVRERDGLMEDEAALEAEARAALPEKTT